MSGFCPACGQGRRGNERLDLRVLTGHFVEDLLSFESTSLRTFRDLWVRPGDVVRDYVRGCRKRYMNPVAYFLLSAAICVVLSASLARWLPSPALTHSDISDNTATNYLLVGLIPVAILWTWLFRKSGFNFTEVMVFALYAMGHFLWIELVLAIPIALFLPNSDWTLLVPLIAMLLFVGRAARQFFQQSLPQIAWKMAATVAVMFVAGTLVVAILDLTGIVPVDVEDPAGAVPVEPAPAP